MSLAIQILISGQGTNCINIATAIESGCLSGLAHISQVIANRPQAVGLAKSANIGLATAAVDHTTFASTSQFEHALIQQIEHYPADLIVLAGFMRVLSPEFVNHFQNKIINIHPSLLPLYPGLHTHARALKNQDTHHGVSVHLVTAELDAGPILGQTSLAIDAHDSVDSLQARIQRLEYTLYPEIIAQIASGRIQLDIARV